jgi:hypothetical protein
MPIVTPTSVSVAETLLSDMLGPAPAVPMRMVPTPPATA